MRKSAIKTQSAVLASLKIKDQLLSRSHPINQTHKPNSFSQHAPPSQDTGLLLFTRSPQCGKLPASRGQCFQAAFHNRLCTGYGSVNIMIIQNDRHTYHCHPRIFHDLLDLCAFCLPVPPTQHWLTANITFHCCSAMSSSVIDDAISTHLWR